MLWHEPSQCDLLFVTLNKSVALFSPTTRYRDLALGPSLFHWESQSITTAVSATGQRYIHHAERGSRVLVFVRVAAGFCAAVHRREGGRAGGVTEPFRCLGFAHYESHEGERPMAIRWRLEREIPAAWLPAMALALSLHQRPLVLDHWMSGRRLPVSSNPQAALLGCRASITQPLI